MNVGDSEPIEHGIALAWRRTLPRDRMVVLPNAFAPDEQLDRPVRIESAGGILRLRP